jgi:predicted DNA-binding protein
MKYTRTNIYLLEDDKKTVAKLAEKAGTKPAELVRRIIREYIEENEKKLLPN